MTNEDKAWEEFSKADPVSLNETSAQGMLQAILAELNSVKADTARLAQKIDGGAEAPMNAEMGGAPPMAPEEPVMPPEGMPMGDEAAMGGAPAEGMSEGAAPPAMPGPEAGAVPPMTDINAVMSALGGGAEQDQTLLALQEALTQVSDPEAIAKLADIIKEYVTKTTGAGEEAIIPPEAAGAVPDAPVSNEELADAIIDSIVGEGDMPAEGDVPLEGLMRAAPEENATADGVPAEQATEAKAPTSPTGATEAKAPTEPVQASEGETEEEDPIIQINLYLGKDISDIIDENEKMGLTDKDDLSTESFKVCDDAEAPSGEIKKSFNELFNEKARQMYGDDGRRYKLPQSANEMKIAEYESIRKSIGSFESVSNLRVGDVLTTMKGLYARGARDLEKTYAPLIDEMVKYCDNKVGPQYTIPIFRSYDIDLAKIYEPVDLSAFEKASRFAGVNMSEEGAPPVSDALKALGDRYDRRAQYLMSGKYQGVEDTGLFTPYDQMIANRNADPVNDEIKAILQARGAGAAFEAGEEDRLRNAIAIRNWLEANTKTRFGDRATDYDYISQMPQFFSDAGGYLGPREETQALASPLLTAADANALAMNTARALTAEGAPRDPNRFAVADATPKEGMGINEQLVGTDMIALARALYKLKDKLDVPSAELGGMTPRAIAEAIGLNADTIADERMLSEAIQGTSNAPKQLGQKTMLKWDGKYYPAPDWNKLVEKADPAFFAAIKGMYRPNLDKSGNDLGGYYSSDDLKNFAGDAVTGKAYGDKLRSSFGGSEMLGYKMIPGLLGTGMEGLFEMPFTGQNSTNAMRLSPEGLKNVQGVIAPVASAEDGVSRMEALSDRLGWTDDMKPTSNTGNLTAIDYARYTPSYPIAGMVANGIAFPKKDPTKSGKDAWDRNVDKVYDEISSKKKDATGGVFGGDDNNNSGRKRKT